MPGLALPARIFANSFSKKFTELCILLLASSMQAFDSSFIIVGYLCFIIIVIVLFGDLGSDGFTLNYSEEVAGLVHVEYIDG